MQRSRSTRALIPGMLGIALVTLAGCGKQEQAAKAAPPQQVSVVTVASEPVVIESVLPGRTAAFRSAEVRPQVDGIIQQRLFKEGSEVKQGQQLYQIDPATYDATYKSAQATLESSKLLAQRYGKLVADEAVSKQAAAEARASWLQAQAAMERAEINLRYTKVLAPISGRVGRSNVTEGALAVNGQSTAFATVQQIDPIYVDVTQPSATLLRLRAELAAGKLENAGNNAARVTLKLEDGSVYPVAGRLEFSEVSVDQSTGSVTLRAVFPNPNHVLLPGMFVHARLSEGVKSNAILAPQVGVTRDLKGQPTALVVNEKDEVEMRSLTTDRAIGDKWLVTSGLNAGDRIIVDGLQFVRPGAKVNPVPAASPATAVTPSASDAASVTKS
ncbi:efflux RND transporter periplasmic adaptor subunit [Caballeronia sp. dw_19]|uniref:efflux RND transporter periplasmic adaptor subunit n=1 Tax=Caballeronia sp. dw_19 TaxID=2719791 RepID=UPI001BD286A4|nr:efflux RND transporter periplasmic adaptor subunit [Caballeronia sp. dw_19]